MIYVECIESENIYLKMEGWSVGIMTSQYSIIPIFHGNNNMIQITHYFSCIRLMHHENLAQHGNS